MSYPYLVRVTGSTAASAYCRTPEHAETRALDLLNTGTGSVTVEYLRRPVLTVTRDEWQKHLRQHGERYIGGWTLPPDQLLIRRIEAGVAALGPDVVAGLRGSRQRADYAQLVAGGMNPEAAEAFVRERHR